MSCPIARLFRNGFLALAFAAAGSIACADPIDTATPDDSTEPPTAVEQPQQETTPMSDIVVMTTSKGVIKIRLDAEKAPITVQNFLAYVDAGHYDGTIVHRVINNFMIQGGGFDAQLRQKPTRAPIKNEAANGLKNARGTIAMARTMVIDSATSQFFINVVDNAFLDFRAPSPQGFGYCVFGEVIEGMDVVDAIKGVPTGNVGPMGDVPREPVVIESVRRAE